jgi:hypothetical protein
MVAPVSYLDRLLNREPGSTLPNPRSMAIFGFVGVALPFFFLGGLVPELLRWTLILGAYLAHPLGALVCFRLPGGWRRHRLALVLNLVGTLAWPAALAAGLAAGLLFFGILLRHLP